MNHWANNAMNGLPAALDPTWSYAAQVIAVSALRILDDPELRSAVTGEYQRRLADAPERFRRPLLPADFAPPVDLPWP